MKNKKNIMIILGVIIIIIVTILIRINASGISRFLKYEEGDYLNISFEFTTKKENEIIINLTDNTKNSKDRIDLLKSIRLLEETEFDEIHKYSDGNLFITLEKEKFIKDRGCNYYDGYISLYLDYNILSLSAVDKKDGFFKTVDKKYYKMDSRSKYLAEKIINDAIKEHK